MVDKKGFGLEGFQIMMLIIAIICAGVGSGLYFYLTLSFEEVAEEKCKEIELELLDYVRGSLFYGSSITCINKKTKEIVKIR